MLKAIFRPRDEWVIVMLGVFLLFIASNTQTGWLYVVDAFLVALLIVGFIVPRLTLRGLEVERYAAPPTWEGDTVTVRLRVRNNSPWPRFVITLTDLPPFADAEPATANADDAGAASVESSRPEVPPRVGPPTAKQFVIGRIPARGGVTVEYRLRCAYRGAFSFRELTVGSATPLGLFPSKRRLWPPSAKVRGGEHAGGELVVYPRGPVLPRIDLISVTPRSATSMRSFQRVGRSYDFQGIREYQSGDDTRFVHWPTTARTGRLMLREFRDLGAERTAILIENSPESALGSPGQTSLDDAARLSAALIAYAQKTGAKVTLVSARGAAELDNPDHNRSLEGTESFTSGIDILPNARGVQANDWLARLHAVEAPPWSDLVEEASPRLERRGRLIVIATRPLTEACVRSLGDLRLSLFVLMLESESYLDAHDSDAAWDDTAHLLVASGHVVRRHRAGDDLSRILVEVREAAS